MNGGSVLAVFPDWVYMVQIIALVIAFPLGWFISWLRHHD